MRLNELEQNNGQNKNDRETLMKDNQIELYNNLLNESWPKGKDWLKFSVKLQMDQKFLRLFRVSGS